MKACVLIASSADRAAAVAEALGGFETMRTSDEVRAELLATIGRFQAVVVDDGFLPRLQQSDLGGSPVIRLDPTITLPELPGIVAAAIRHSRDDDHRGAPALEPLTALPYSTYLDLVRFRATRRYLLGLMRRHHGSVTEASLTAGIARESLHRQLRRHDVDPDAFREPDAR